MSNGSQYARNLSDQRKIWLRWPLVAVLASTGASALFAQDVFDGSIDEEFGETGNWVGGLPGGYPDFVGNTVDFQTINDFDVNVDDLITGLGGFINTTNFNNTFASKEDTGAFAFISGATIDPGSGSFTFNIDMTAAGFMTLDLSLGGSMTFLEHSAQFQSATALLSGGGGGILKTDGADVRFLGAVTSDAGGHFLSEGNGSFVFNSGFVGTGAQTFELGLDGAFVFKATSEINGTTTFINDVTQTGTFSIDSGSVAFNGAVTSDANGNFFATDGGDFIFNDTFVATGDQSFAMDDGGGYAFNGATSFDGGTITATGDDSVSTTRLIFDGAVTNGVDGGATAAELRTEGDADWIFNDEYIFFGSQLFSAVEGSGGSFTFNDFAGSSALLLSGDDTFSADGAIMIFNREVHVGASTTVSATNGATYTFDAVHQSDADAIYSAQDGSTYVFSDEFNGTGNQTFTAGNAEDFGFNEVFFAGGGVATFSNVTVTIDSLTVEDAFGFAFDGIDQAAVEVRVEGVFEGSHTFTFEDDAVFTANGEVSFADDATITLVGDGSLNANGEVTTGTGTTTFVLNPSAVTDESLNLSLGSVSSAVKLGGDLVFNGSSASEDENAVANIAGAVELVGDIEETTITANLGTGGILQLSNNALQNVKATLDVQSGTVQAIGGSSMGNSDVTVNLAADTTLQLQSTNAGNVGFLIGDLQGDALSVIESMAPESGVDLGAVLRVEAGDFAGTMQDGDADSPLSLTSSKGKFTFSGTGTYTGATNAVNEGVLLVTGSIDGTSQVNVLNESKIRIEDGSMAVVSHSDIGDGSIDVQAGGTFNVGKNTGGGGLIGGTLSAEGTLSVGGNFNARGTSTSTIEGVGTVSQGGTLALADEAMVDFTFNSDDNDDEDAFVIDAGGTVSLTDASALSIINGSASVAGVLELSGESAAFTADSLSIAKDGAFTAEGETSVVITQGMSVAGSGTVTGPVTLSAETLTIADGGSLSFVFDEDEHADYAAVTLAGDLMVETGGSLVGDATFDFGGSGDFKYAGHVQVGAAGSSEGYMEINGGKLEAMEDGELVFGLSYDAITLAGSNAFLRVVGDVADFSENDRLVLDVEGTNYIPTNVDFTLLRAEDFILPDGVTTLDPVLARNSVTRTWLTETQSVAGGDLELTATTSADYLGFDSEGAQCLTGDLAPIGSWLNSMIVQANANPDGDVAAFLGSLDAVETCPDYESAVRGIQPTTTASVIHVAPQTQFFDVLRHEIRREAMSEGVGSPVPLRLENGEEMLFMQSDEQALAATVRRTSRPKTDYAMIGRFFGRTLTTPTEGNIIGFSGNEYGGFAGFAFDLEGGMVIGFDLGYSAFNGDLEGGFGTERIGTMRAGPYMSYVDESGWFVDAAISGGWNHYDFTRVDPTLPAGGSVSGKGDGWEIDVSIGGGKSFELHEGISITPQASMLYSYVNTGTISETSNGGSLFALDIDPGDLNAFSARAGANISFKMLPGLVVDVEGGWQGNFTMSNDYTASIPGTGGDPLPILSVDQSTTNTFYYGVGVNWLATWNVGVNLRYAGRSGDGYESNMIYGGLSLRF